MEKEKITFGHKEYFKTPRFRSYFIMIVLFTLLSIYLVEQIISPDESSFIPFALLISGAYLSLFALRIKKNLMF